jgi:hypothetical protein
MSIHIPAITRIHAETLKFLIRCMKDGELVETGTHSELMAVKGEYHLLYDMQARAFAAENAANVSLDVADSTKA